MQPNQVALVVATCDFGELGIGSLSFIASDGMFSALFEGLLSQTEKWGVFSSIFLII
ncbi:hypothetical protein [Paraburkholderia sediminicola]|uniref:hypothetical protein n=1 Tax=Paraburkholderia sediminicola TaxID=458836 RepID=UPI0038BAF8E6